MQGMSRERWKPPRVYPGKAGTSGSLCVYAGTASWNPPEFPQAAQPQPSPVGTPLWHSGVTFGVCLCPLPSWQCRHSHLFPKKVKFWIPKAPCL